MDDRRLLRTGIAGSIVAALCCFTPVLVILLGVAGFAGAVAWLDMILVPALMFFLALTGYALWRRRRSS